jgi:phospholipase/lecithinase/hemolysin
MKELEQATMEVAQEKGVAVADIAAEFRRTGSAEQALQQSYWAWDKTHLGTNGHRLVAATVMKALTAAE